jgi:hypothetical protein
MNCWLVALALLLPPYMKIAYHFLQGANMNNMHTCAKQILLLYYKVQRTTVKQIYKTLEIAPCERTGLTRYSEIKLSSVWVEFFFRTVVRNKVDIDTYSINKEKNKAKPRTHLGFAFLF